MSTKQPGLAQRIWGDAPWNPRNRHGTFVVSCRRVGLAADVALDIVWLFGLGTWRFKHGRFPPPVITIVLRDTSKKHLSSNLW